MASLGECKTTIPNSLPDIDRYISSTNIACSSLLNKFGAEPTRLERYMAEHTKDAGRIYVGRSAAPTIRERDRIRDQIAEENAAFEATQQAHNDRMAALQASLPSSTRAPRGRRDR
jgi:hypothetical protein